MGVQLVILSPQRVVGAWLHTAWEGGRGRDSDNIQENLIMHLNRQGKEGYKPNAGEWG